MVNDHNCRNCGAPVIPGHICEYCGTFMRDTAQAEEQAGSYIRITADSITFGVVNPAELEKAQKYAKISGRLGT